MPTTEAILLVISLLFLLSVIASKISSRFGVPALLLFAVIGMLAGSDGPGGIYFDYPWATQFLGITALALILFSAGFETNFSLVRPVLWQGISLATVGVAVSAVVVGLFSSWLLHLPVEEGLLIGAIISSTDAAAVFNVLRSRRLYLKGNLGELIELESGSNDPMAVLLTIALIRLMSHPETTLGSTALMVVVQLLLGAAAGYVIGRLIVVAVNRIRLEWEGLYPVFTVAMAVFAFAAIATMRGSGFVGVYVAGIIVGAGRLTHRTTLRLFHEGVAWLMQIAMFLVLGLQVFPSELPRVAISGMLIAFFLMLVARPVSVFVALPTSTYSVREKLFIAWAGLRGAAPIILATFPLLAGIKDSHLIFNIVFFVALTSLLLQGTTLAALARYWNLTAVTSRQRAFPLLFNPDESIDSHMADITVEAGSAADNRKIMDLQLPENTLVVLVSRKERFVVPQGSTILRGGDRLMVLLMESDAPGVRQLFARTSQA